MACMYLYGRLYYLYFLIILLLFFKDSYLNYLVIPFLSEETIDLGIDEILYVKSFLINNISSLSTLIGSGFISEGDANLLVEKYQETRVISFSSLVLLSIILSFISYKNLSVRYDARRRVERILKFIFFYFFNNSSFNYRRYYLFSNL